jgi:lactoylglutathione lyase
VAHFDKCNVKFVKRPEEGSMRDLAFIQDPDGYWIEVIQADLMRQFAAGA